MIETQLIEKQAKKIFEEFRSDWNGHDAHVKINVLKDLLVDMDNNEKAKKLISNLESKIAFISYEIHLGNLKV